MLSRRFVGVKKECTEFFFSLVDEIYASQCYERDCSNWLVNNGDYKRLV
jgi:hypothetical protein